MRPVRWKPLSEIGNEWNSVASICLEQITAGRDLSYIHILKPCVLDLCSGTNLEFVVDVGCGVGALSLELADRAKHIVGIDISDESVRLARQTAQAANNIRFEKMAAETLQDNFPSNTFSVAIANMSFSAIPNLAEAIESISMILVREGHLIATIPHPWFWPVYAGFHDAEWFDYSDEIPIEWEFEISLERTGTATTFIHRPLSLYCSLLKAAGMVIEALVEPAMSG